LSDCYRPKPALQIVLNDFHQRFPVYRFSFSLLHNSWIKTTHIAIATKFTPASTPTIVDDIKNDIGLASSNFQEKLSDLTHATWIEK
jgi:hypothetical protein